MNYQQGPVFSSVVSTYTPIEYIDEASRVPSARKPAGTGVTIDGFDRLRRQLVHVSRGRVVLRSRQNHRRGVLFRVHADNLCRRRRCVWELSKHDPPLEAVASVFEATSLWEFAPLLMRGQSLGTPSVMKDDWGLGVCDLECCLEPMLQGMTSQCGGIRLISCQTYRSIRYRVDVLPILPKRLVPVSMSHRYRYRLRYIRAYRYRRYRY